MRTADETLRQLYDLTGEVALVTGAAGGLGAHISTVLAAAGAKVALASRNVAGAAAVADKIEAAGGRALPFSIDVTDSVSVVAALDSAETELGPISILVNNAGIAVNKPLLEHGDDDWNKVIATNLSGAFVVAREAARQMIRHHVQGRIINIASIAARQAFSGLHGYAASKAGLVQLTRTLGLELGANGITVNAIAPGYVETALTTDFLKSEAGQRLRQRVPLRRFGVPADLDGAILLLAGPGGRYMTGAVVTVDGGLCLRTA